MTPFTQYLMDLFATHENRFPDDGTGFLAGLRREAAAVFAERGFPSKKMEAWRHYPLDQHAKQEYALPLDPEPCRNLEEIFQCKLPNIATNMFILLNGWYAHQRAPLTTFPNGVVVGSLGEALRQYPSLVKPRLGRRELWETDPLAALNGMFFTDGLFIYVPDNVHMEQPIQMVNLASSPNPLLIQSKNLILVGKNASLSIIHCNDSIQDRGSFTNNATELHLDKSAQVNYYKMENKDPRSLLVDHLLVNAEADTRYSSHAITLNAGYVRTMITVGLNGPHAEADLKGLYLVDKSQYVDNHIRVNHHSGECASTQLYKGVVDDEATAHFNGHILVTRDAQRTVAFQTNRNITLTDKARVMTQPFLEIYADDVQCSHGATVGQLNDEALFYLRSRGICERNARMLLLYAFAVEIVESIAIENLRHQLTDMVKKRIRGEFSPCDECVLRCSAPEKISFASDLDKI